MLRFFNLFQSYANSVSYSTKVKIVIAFSAFLSVFSIGYLINLQAPLLKNLEMQTAAISYFDAWTRTAVVLTELNHSPNPDKYSQFLNELAHLKEKQQFLSDIAFNNYFPVWLQIHAITSTLPELGENAIQNTLSTSFIENQIAFMNDALLEELFVNKSLFQGTDIPTYLLANMLTNKNTASMHRMNHPLSSTLSFALDSVVEELLPYPPGKVLDDVTALEHASANDLLEKRLIFQQDLSSTLYSLLGYQYHTLLLRQRISAICVFIGILIVLTIYSTREMRAPLTELRFAALQLAKGNLWQRASVVSKDEVAEMCERFNTMAGLMEQAVTSTSIMSNKLTETMSAIVSSAEDFEQNVSDQDKTIALIAQNTAGIIQTSKDVGAALEQALQAATATHEFAISAQGNVRSIEVVLRGAGTAAQHIGTTLQHLEEKVASLNTIITTIITVADEANLLAINTALISQSKHHGRTGFSIIASKIGELASKTAYVTLSIEASVKSILQALSTAGKQAHLLSLQMRSHTNATSILVEQFSVMMQSAAEQRETCAMMQVAIQEQEKSAELIHNTITLLSQGAKITTRSVRNLYSQIQYLGEASSNLQIIFHRFHLRP